MSFLRLENLSVGYGQKEIISPINVAVEEGQIVGVLGKNGAGKSSLLRTLLGLQTALSGSICYQNKIISTQNKIYRASLFSAVLSKPYPPANLTVFDLVSLGRIPHKKWLERLHTKDLEIIEYAIHLVEIAHLQHKFCAELSDGQLQMAFIARAIAQDTPIICMDEPTSHLDTENKFKIFRLIDNLSKKTKKTILISTHEQEIALLQSDSLWYVSEGILHTGMPEDVAFQQKIMEQTDDSDLQFNYNSGKFQPKKYAQKTIALEGENPLLYWVLHALQRYDITQAQFPNATIKVTKNTITLNNDGKLFHFEQIEALIHHLINNKK